MDHKIPAPFTPDQVASINAYQIVGMHHPYTCPNRDDGRHVERDDDRDHGMLAAHQWGLVCPHCFYTQDWAHEFTADWNWRRIADV